jgi:hypothetical protein
VAEAAGMTTPDIAAVMAAAMDGENRRRELAGQAPGLGALLPLPQPPAGPGVGTWDVPGLDVQGEGYTSGAPAAAAQVYVPHGTPVFGARPHYAGPEVAGIGHPLGIAQPSLRHVHDLGDGTLFIEGASAPVDAYGFTVVSPPARPGLLARLLGRLRRH